MGHVIENPEDWEAWFGREVLASPMDIAPDRWRKARRVREQDNKQRLGLFKKAWDAFDWTKMLA